MDSSDSKPNRIKSENSISSSNTKDPLSSFKNPIQQRWKIVEKIGSGGFGVIYKAIDQLMKDMVAIKVEKRQDKSSLLKEVGYYKYLERYSQYSGFPQVSPRCRWQGKENKICFAVFDLLGPSLSDLFQKCKRKFSLKTVLMLADQMIDRLSLIHQCGIIHGDVKPGNFVIGGIGDEKNIYVIDFGLSNFWRDKHGNHIQFHANCAFKGTYRYASINSHFKMEQSRRDDLESLGYVLIYFLNGKLPWQNLKINKSERRKVIGKIKSNILIEQIAENLPEEFLIYMNYVRKLRFSDEPDYNWIKNLFRNCLKRHRLEYDYVFDWDLSNTEESKPMKYEPCLPNNFKAFIKSSSIFGNFSQVSPNNIGMPFCISYTNPTLLYPCNLLYQCQNTITNYLNTSLYYNYPVYPLFPLFGSYYNGSTSLIQNEDVISETNKKRKRQKCKNNSIEVGIPSKRVSAPMQE